MSNPEIIEDIYRQCFEIKGGRSLVIVFRNLVESFPSINIVTKPPFLNGRARFEFLQLLMDRPNIAVSLSKLDLLASLSVNPGKSATFALSEIGSTQPICGWTVRDEDSEGYPIRTINRGEHPLRPKLPTPLMLAQNIVAAELAFVTFQNSQQE